MKQKSNKPPAEKSDRRFLFFQIIAKALRIFNRAGSARIISQAAELLFIIGRRNTYIFAKNLAEVSFRMKIAHIRNLVDQIFGAFKILYSVIDFYRVKIIVRRLTELFLKKTIQLSLAGAAMCSDV